MTAGAARLLRIAALIVLALFSAGPSAAQSPERVRDSGVTVSVFWQIGCPFCERALDYLDRTYADDPSVVVWPLELVEHPLNQAAFMGIVERFAIERPAVPLILVGEHVFIGFRDDATSGAEISAAVEACRAAACPDLAGALLAALDEATVSNEARGTPAPASPDTHGTPTRTTLALPEKVSIPLVGDVVLRDLSLPALTIVLAAIDGFNPCAMWVLVFLIGLLIGTRDQLRMWTFGGVFLLTSAAVYFALMAAWLNVVLLLGALVWLRLGVGVLALGGGLWHLREFFRNSDAVCEITAPGQRQRLRERFRAAIGERNFVLALLAVAALAFVVNLIELLCSAGIPAVYAQVLSMSALPIWQSYLYLALYIAVFLIDDVIVFVVAMLSLQAAGATTLYSRYSSLVGGVILSGIGLLLLFAPNWLTFSA